MNPWAESEDFRQVFIGMGVFAAGLLVLGLLLPPGPVATPVRLESVQEPVGVIRSIDRTVVAGSIETLIATAEGVFNVTGEVTAANGDPVEHVVLRGLDGVEFLCVRSRCYGLRWRSRTDTVSASSRTDRTNSA